MKRLALFAAVLAAVLASHAAAQCPSTTCPAPWAMPTIPWTAPAPRAQAPAAPAQIARYPAICRVECEAGDGTETEGTGCYVADAAGNHGDRLAIILTASHVLPARPGPIVCRFPALGEAHGATVVSIAGELAALLIHRPSTRPLPVADQSPAVGQTVTLCGFGGWPRAGFSAHQARLLQWVGLSPDDRSAIELSSPSSHGDSGGPVLDPQGRVCAVILATSDNTTTAVCGRRAGRCGPLRAILAAALAPFRALRRPIVPRDDPAPPPRVEGPPPSTDTIVPSTGPAAGAESPADFAAEVAKLRADFADQLAKLRAELADQMADARGPAGPPGPQGPPGKPGPAATIKPIPAAPVDLDALAEAVRRRIAGSLHIRVTPIQGPPPNGR